MAADARVIPIGHDQRAIGGHAHIARPKPAVGRAIGNGFCCGAGAGTNELQMVRTDDVRSGIAVDERAGESLRQEISLVDTDPGGGAGAGEEEVGNHAGIVLMPVAEGDLRFHIGAWHLPALPGAFVNVAVISPLQNEVDPHPLVAVVVVVALPE